MAAAEWLKGRDKTEEGVPKISALSGSLLAAALDACPVGLSIQDEEGRVIAANAVGRVMAASLARLPRPAGAPADREGSAIRRQLQSFRHEGRDFTLTALLDLHQDVAAQRELLRLAYFDNLTGLPNGMLLEEHVGDLITSSTTDTLFGLAFIDLDNFKDINDYYGHDIGDLLLKKIADRVITCLRTGDMLSRVGGDEFVLLISPASDESSTRAFAVELGEKLKHPFFIDGHEIFVSASTGISLYPLHGTDFESLRRQADSAMYKVKQKGKGGVVVFNKELSAEANSRMAVEQRLRLAIRDCRVCCAFQPQVKVETGEVVGVEVLLRWRDEEGEIQAPGDFVNLAVELGLINEIAFRILTETVRSVPIINETFGASTSISINIAAKQAIDVTFMKDFIDSIGATGLAERFILELTEEAFFCKGPFQLQVLPHLRRSGIRISIDDFGSGFSSLGAITEIHADELKIDRSFISRIHQRPRSQVVVKAIEEIGRSLGMTVLAEGVETQEEADYIVGNTHIQFAQGYLFGRPAVIQQTHTEHSLHIPRWTGSDQRWTPLPRRHQIGRAGKFAGGR
jgi:diguanylate cyclase (GGDEF)-like protein